MPALVNSNYLLTSATKNNHRSTGNYSDRIVDDFTVAKADLIGMR